MPTGQYTRKKEPLLDRFMRYVDIRPNGCWLWTGALHPQGYGMLSVDGKNRKAHHVALYLRDGVWPDTEKYEVDHVCHKLVGQDKCAGGPTCMHRRCVNVEHLELGTHKENSSASRSNSGRILGVMGAARQLAKTECPAGHPYSPENTRYDKRGKRYCRACHRAKCAARRARLKAASLPSPDPSLPSNLPGQAG
jgi:hypothetical protein